MDHVVTLIGRLAVRRRLSRCEGASSNTKDSGLISRFYPPSQQHILWGSQAILYSSGEMF